MTKLTRHPAAPAREETRTATARAALEALEQAYAYYTPEAAPETRPAAAESPLAA